MTEEDKIETFKCIVNFVKDIHSEFGNNDKPIKLYNHLLEKTKLSNTVAIQKHVDAFKSFFELNDTAMKEKDFNLFKEESKISYNEKVFIDILKFFKESKENRENLNIIWMHLYTICNKVLSDEIYVNHLKTLEQENKQNNSNEDIFINNIMGKVESAVSGMNTSSNPMAAISSILASGVLNDVMTGMKTGIQDGSLNVNKMMSSVLKIATKATGGTGIPPEIMGTLTQLNINGTEN